MPSTYLQTVAVHQTGPSRWHVRARFQDLSGKIFHASFLMRTDPGTQQDIDAMCQAFVAEHDQALEEQELGEVERLLVEEGVNPFQNLQRVTRAQALRRMMDRHLTSPALKLVRWAHFLDNVTNGELAAIGLSAAQIAALRNRVDQIKSIRTAIANHDAEV